jgi:hypothetical protein
VHTKHQQERVSVHASEGRFGRKYVGGDGGGAVSEKGHNRDFFLLFG